MSEAHFPRRLAAFTLVAMLISVSLYLVFSPRDMELPEGDLPTFESEAQLREFLAIHRPRGWDMIGLGEEDGGCEVQHSSTNVQVVGVDEIDTVKNDGKHLFVSSVDKVTIIEVTPHGDMHVISAINVTEMTGRCDSYAQVIGLLLWENTLAVVLNEYVWSSWALMGPQMDAIPQTDGPMTSCVLLDITDTGDPEVVYRCSMSGWFTAGRSMDGLIYLLGQEDIWGKEDISLPLIEREGRTDEVEATDVRFDPQATEQNAFLNIMALDMNARRANFTTLVMGYSSVVYVSMHNMYLTNVVYHEGGNGIFDQSMPSTNIVRLRLDGTSVIPEAKGQVTGSLHNQFSMDEHKGMLRVVTCTSWMGGESRVFVLDEGLHTIGSLVGIAPGEDVQSARFLGDTLYLVTFLNTDPLFVIDMSDPSSPRLLGDLIVPGFSTYLHPLGDGMLVGVGLDNWAFKVSMYDVSSPASPKEVETLMAPNCSWSEANWDHKAVLFDPQRSWMFVPYNSYDQISYDLDQVVWIIATGEGGLTTMAELEVGSGACFVRCVLIEGMLFVVTDSQVTSYDMDGFMEVGMIEHGGLEIIRDEDNTMEQFIER